MSKPSKKFLFLPVLALASVAALVAGCGDDPAADSCFDYGSFNGTSPAVKFQADVLPILRNSCGLSGACHGMQSGPAGQPFLGPPNSAGMTVPQSDIDAIFNQNVGVASTKAATMKIVDPGKPETSFLMHKSDNTLSCADVKCEAGCGASMPLSSDILPQDKRDIIRRWIAQGAKKD